MLDEVDFDLLVNLTPMALHAPFNRKALEAGRHVWCEKPIATDLKEAQDLLALAERERIGLWAAPCCPMSSAFQAMAQVLSAGALGHVYVAHGIFGWSGPTWPGSAWFYQKGGGSLFDLGVYNLTMLTGLLGPARSVVAMAGTAIRERVIAGETIPVEADDNAALILDHGDTVYSVIQTGFVYAAQRDDWTIQLIGTNGAMIMGGSAPGPIRDVAIYIGDQMKAPGQWKTVWQGPGDYVFWEGATYIAECLAKEEKPLLSGEHAVHVLEVMLAAQRAAKTGHRVPITSTFPWPQLKARDRKEGSEAVVA